MDQLMNRIFYFTGSSTVALLSICKKQAFRLRIFSFGCVLKTSFVLLKNTLLCQVMIHGTVYV